MKWLSLIASFIWKYKHPNLSITSSYVPAKIGVTTADPTAQPVSDDKESW